MSPVDTRRVIFERGGVRVTSGPRGIRPTVPPPVLPPPLPPPVNGGQGKGKGGGSGAPGQGKGQGAEHGKGLGAGNSLSALALALGAISSTSGVVVPSPPAVPAALTLLSTTTLAVDGTFDVSGIAQTYSDLVVVLNARGTDVATFETLQMRFNNDSGANYSYQRLSAQTATVAGTAAAAATSFTFANLPGSTATAGFFGQVEFTIAGYTSTTWQKTFTGSSFARNGTGTEWMSLGGVWASTAAVTRIGLFGTVTPNLLTGSVMRIYGRQ